MIFASTNPNLSGFTDFLNPANHTGTGSIEGSGAVEWIWPTGAPTASFTLYIVKAGGALVKTPSAVQITGGNGTVAYTVFVSVP